MIKSIAQPLVCAFSLMLFGQSALAQVGSGLPTSTTEAISISSAQQSQIDEFVQSWTQRALSDNPQDIKRALEALTKPLTKRGVSVAFRQSYTRAISPLMDELDKKGTIGATLASLRIAGDLATPSAVSRVKAAISNEDLGIQLFGVSRAGQIFATTSRNGQAITPNDAIVLIDALEALSMDQGIDHELLHACVRALNRGTRLTSKDMEAPRSRSIIALSDALGTQLRSLNVNDDPSFALSIALEAASATTGSISDISSQTTPQAIKSAVRLGGDIISVSLRRVLGGTMEPVGQRDLSVRSLQAGESLLYFALSKDAELNNNPIGVIRPTKFAEKLAAGDDRTFRNEASSLLGSGSSIVTRFGFAEDRFLF